MNTAKSVGVDKPIILRDIYLRLTGAPPKVSATASSPGQSTEPAPAVREARVFQRHRPLPLGGRTEAHEISQVAVALLPARHYRMGVLRSTSEHSDRSLASSILAALYPSTSRETSQMVHSLEMYLEYLRHSLAQNSAVDKIKNTRRVQQNNAALMELLAGGNWNAELLQRLVELEEINMLIFDLYRHETTLYWAHGVTWPHLNLFRPLICLVCLGDTFEPIICPCRDREACEREVMLRLLARDDILGQPPTFSLPGWLTLERMAADQPDLWATLCRKYTPELLQLSELPELD